MKRIWQLRAYGDFTIAVQSLFYSTQPADYHVVASQHHLPLFKALCAVFPQLTCLPIQFVNFGIDKPLLRAFTNRHILHKATIAEINAIKTFMLNNPTPKEFNFIDQEHRKWLLQWGTQHAFDTIVKGNWIYEDYHAFFKTHAPIISHEDVAGTKNKQVLILPSARISKRNIPEWVVNELVNKHSTQGDRVSIAYFKQSPHGEKTYTNFDALVQLIQEADFVYGADSLPIHLSYLLQKPHYILYPKGGSKQFFTPYTLTHQQYKTF